jgi:hypothetical protein
MHICTCAQEAMIMGNQCAHDKEVHSDGDKAMTKTALTKKYTAMVTSESVTLIHESMTLFTCNTLRGI